MGDSEDLAVLQVVRLKGGLADAAVVAPAAGVSEEDAGTRLRALEAAGTIQDRRGRYRLTPEGRDGLERLLEAERATVDAARVRELYDEFLPYNVRLKEIAHDWQLKDGEPNDHADEVHDAEVLARLRTLDEEFSAVVDRIADTAGRLRTYGARLTHALRQVEGGNHAFLLSPVVDSYHQVWFELHEDLMLLAGHDRQTEAAAGRAE